MKLTWRGWCLKSSWCSFKRQIATSCRYGIEDKTSHSRFTASPKSQARLESINSRLPKFLRGYTAPLTNAPLSHVSAFLVLHELTAVIPLFALAGIFHYTQWMPSVIGEWKWAADGAEKFGRYFRKKGWLSDEIEGVGELKPNLSGETRSSIILEYVNCGFWF